MYISVYKYKYEYVYILLIFIWRKDKEISWVWFCPCFCPIPFKNHPIISWSKYSTTTAPNLTISNILFCTYLTPLSIFHINCPKLLLNLNPHYLSFHSVNRVPYECNPGLSYPQWPIQITSSSVVSNSITLWFTSADFLSRPDLYIWTLRNVYS